MLKFFEKDPLTPEQISFWDENGYLILPGFFDAETVAAANAEVDRILSGDRTRYADVTVDIIAGAMAGKRVRIADVPDEALKGPIKINDLFLKSSVIQRCNLDRSLLRILDRLMDGDPIVVNSLNFIYGSQQPAHYDSWFMSPPVRDKMAVASICLDPYTDENGPLFLYPGSHKLPPYIFSNGKITAVPEELPAAHSHAEASTRGIEKTFFYGKPGDVLIWHSQLLHGGAPLRDPAQTRRSLVTHYWRAKDLPRQRRTLIVPGGYVLADKDRTAA